MEHQDIVRAIQFIRPNAQFSVDGDKIIWLDANESEPTKAQIEKGFADYLTDLQAKEVAKETAKAALLDKLGITENEAKLLLN